MNNEHSANQSSHLTWFKSSYSGSDGGDCVEVAAAPHTVHVRDSKHVQGPILHFPTDHWNAFIAFAGTQPTTPA
ncbi:DUF397 domain-containing protein [Streptomyces sp. NPDC102274]|uniref:DUF397 domain-containing protein n=1 Tax=Streptomyces sp. NPDC102274 TaxID=3366151 RepID=UPI0038050C12